MLIDNVQMKADLRNAAEAEECRFYSRNSTDEWFRALELLGTSPEKPHLVDASGLIVIFCQTLWTI